MTSLMAETMTSSFWLFSPAKLQLPQQKHRGARVHHNVGANLLLNLAHALLTSIDPLPSVWALFVSLNFARPECYIRCRGEVPV